MAESTKVDNAPNTCGRGSSPKALCKLSVLGAKVFASKRMHEVVRDLTTSQCCFQSRLIGYVYRASFGAIDLWSTARNRYDVVSLSDKGKRERSPDEPVCSNHSDLHQFTMHLGRSKLCAVARIRSPQRVDNAALSSPR